MSMSLAAWLLVAVALVAANLPWLSDRLLFVFPAPGGGKRAWMRWTEWFLLYLLTGFFALGLEKKVRGEIYHQGWEFYAVTLCLFLVFALPGFIYRYAPRHHLARR